MPPLEIPQQKLCAFATDGLIWSIASMGNAPTAMFNYDQGKDASVKFAITVACVVLLAHWQDSGI